MRIKSRKWWVLGVGALILAYLLYKAIGALRHGQFSLHDMWLSWSGANPRYILAAVVLIYVCYFLRALRWQNFQKHVGTSRLGSILSSTFAGFSAVFLFGRVGEPVRPLLISRKDKIPLADTFGIYALERFLDLGFSGVILSAWFLITTIQKYFYHSQISPVIESVRKTAGTIVIFGILFVAALFFYIRAHGAALVGRRMQLWLEMHGWRASVARIVLGLGRGLKTIRTWRDLFYALGVSALHWFLIILVYYLIQQGFGGKLATLRFQDAMLVLALTLVGSLFQLPGIGGGPQAVMIGAFTGFYGVPREAAVAAAMVIYLISFAMCTIVGVPLLFREGLSLGELKRLRQQETAEIDAEIATSGQ